MPSRAFQSSNPALQRRPRDSLAAVSRGIRRGGTPTRQAPPVSPVSSTAVTLASPSARTPGRKRKVREALNKVGRGCAI